MIALEKNESKVVFAHESRVYAAVFVPKFLGGSDWEVHDVELFQLDIEGEPKGPVTPLGRLANSLDSALQQWVERRIT